MLPTLTDECEGFQISVHEVIADGVGKAREVKLEVGPEDMTGLLKSHDQTLGWGISLRVNKESGVLRWNLLLVKML